jgi:hypothetical protein
MTTAEIRRLAPTLARLLVLLRSPTARDYDGPVLTEREWARLPTYGGHAPRSTSGVWSWDADALLVGTCAEDVRLEARALCSQYDCYRVADATGCAAGRCAAHTQQQRRRGTTKPIRQPAAGRVGVRLSASTLTALGPQPAVRAREVLEEWATGTAPP